MLLWLIVSCEIGFWIFLIIGLLFRYILKLPKLGKAILYCIPLLDILLLVATAIDLDKGVTAEFARGLAAFYLGFTVVYGGSLIRWVDQYAANKLNGINQKIEPDKYGWSYAIHEWKQWLRGVTAGGIAAILLFLAILFVNEPAGTNSLYDWFYSIFWILLIWLICWPLRYPIFPKQNPSS